MLTATKLASVLCITAKKRFKKNGNVISQANPTRKRSKKLTIAYFQIQDMIYVVYKWGIETYTWQAADNTYLAHINLSNNPFMVDI